MKKLVGLHFSKADRKELVNKFSNLKLKGKTAIQEKWNGSKAQAFCQKTAIKAGNAKKAIALSAKDFSNNPKAYLKETRVAKAYNSGKFSSAAKKYSGISYFNSQLKARKARIEKEASEKRTEALFKKFVDTVGAMTKCVDGIQAAVDKYPRPEPAKKTFSAKLKDYTGEKYLSLQYSIKNFNDYTSSAIKKFRTSMKGNMDSLKSKSFKENWNNFRTTFMQKYSKLMKEVKRLPATIKWKLGKERPDEALARINDRFKDFFENVQSIEGVNMSRLPRS